MKIRRIYRFKCILIITLIDIFCTNMSVAQPNSLFRWSFDGNIRYRYEKWDNMNAKSYGDNPEIGNPDDNILLQRIIAGTTLHLNDHITISAHLQDSRAFGWSLAQDKEPDAFKIHPQNVNEPFYIMNPHEEFLEIYEANIRVDSIFKHFSVIAGRQKIAYTDYRVFGPGSWGNTGRWSWDAIRLMIKKDNWSGGIWYGGTKIHDPEKTCLPFTHTEYNGGGIHGNMQFMDYLQTDVYLAHKHQGSADYIREKNINRNWIGFRFYNPESIPWKYEASYTHEFGKENEMVIHAYGFFFKLGYQFEKLFWNPCVTFRYTYAEGDHPGTEYNEKFDPVFGAGDRYYGWMNLVKWSNLDDMEIMVELYPLIGMRIELKYNILKIPQSDDITIMGNLELPEGKNHLGNEIDLFTEYDFNDRWQFTAVLGYFIAKDAVTITTTQPGNALMISFQVRYTFNLKIV
ncbi:MAG: alginate export family protein [Cyclobacteriaceae bacterium]|nr:alginate export family protein [Cyclobacteriaceae bacterium]